MVHNPRILTVICRLKNKTNLDYLTTWQVDTLLADKFVLMDYLNQQIIMEVKVLTQIEILNRRI